MSHIKRTWIQENTWICSSCKTVNEGHRLVCKECGSPREKNETDIVPAADATKAVTDAQKLKEAALGANWVCTFCGGQVRDDNGNCKNCDAAKNEGANTHAPKMGDDYVSAQRPPGLKPGQPRNFITPRLDPTAELPVKMKRPFNWFKLIIWIACSIGGLGIVWAFIPHQHHAAVSTTHWHYVTKVRQRTLMHDSGWGSPSGAFNVSCERKKKGTEDCNPHNCNPHSEQYQTGSHECNCRQSCTSNKNGYSTCTETCDDCPDYSTRTAYDTCYEQCDVYDKWCTYDYYDWPVVDTQQTEGDGTTTAWPAVTAGANQRLDNNEEYIVGFVYDGNAAAYHPSTLADYQRFAVGKHWLIKVNALHMVFPLHAEDDSW